RKKKIQELQQVIEPKLIFSFFRVYDFETKLYSRVVRILSSTLRLKCDFLRIVFSGFLERYLNVKTIY
ncbi:MAG: hypothetical protein ACO3L1_07160, partial [Flavobacteriaceae bacterium]